MPKKVNRLSAVRVASTKKPGFYADGDGLYLQVTGSGSRSWVFRIQNRFAPSRVGKRQTPEARGTYVTPVFGALPVQNVDVALVLNALEPIWTIKPETASRVRGRIERILDWAKARGFRQGENPARWRGRLDTLLVPRTKVQRLWHHAALPYSELPGFSLKIRQRDAVAARALEFSILTAARTGEVLGARWDEIDLENEVWTVPASRMKAGREHGVPMSTATLTILTRLQAIRQNDFVFPGERWNKPLSNMSMLMMLRRICREDLTVHGFRSTFRDWAAEQTNFPREVAEAALAHVIADRTEAAYRRGDLFEKRRSLMAEWAAFCQTEPNLTGAVVQITRAKIS